MAVGLVLGPRLPLHLQADWGQGLRLHPAWSTEDLTDGSYDDVLDAEPLEELLHLLESTKHPVIIEKALVTLGSNVGSSAKHVILRELDGISIIGSKIGDPNHSNKEKALTALSHLSVDVENK